MPMPEQGAAGRGVQAHVNTDVEDKSTGGGGTHAQATVVMDQLLEYSESWSEQQTGVAQGHVNADVEDESSGLGGADDSHADLVVHQLSEYSESWSEQETGVAQGHVNADVEDEIAGGGADDSHATVVILVSICTEAIAAVAAIHKGGYKAAYITAIAGVVVMSLAEMLVAIWIAYSTVRRGRVAKILRYASILTLVLAIGLDVAAYILKK
jgi:hypothetical protein